MADPDVLSEDGETPEPWYVNYYFHCGVQWDDEWNCMCNDECPVCHGEIEPYASIDTADDSEVIHAQDVYDLVDGNIRAKDAGELERPE